ncbi:MAG: RCC1 domain-containing protein, partial [Acidimicrobiales bacterium]
MRRGTAVLTVAVAVTATPVGARRAFGAVPVTCQPATGHVRDIYGAALAGTNLTDGDCSAAATTDVTGAYSIAVQTPNGSSVSAAKAGYTTTAQTVTVVGGPTGANDIQARFALAQASVTPTALRSGRTLSFSAETTAPPPDPRAGYVCGWGNDGYGELGGGPSSATEVPIPGPGGSGSLSGASALAEGAYHGLALRPADGSVVAWGWNLDGELGNGTTTINPTPGVVLGVGGTGTLSGVKALSAGLYHSVALRSDATVVTWGYNADGELGNGTTTKATSPVQVAGVGGTGVLSGITAVSSRALHSLALRTDGTVVAWGYNNHGQLGNASTTNSSTPVQVAGVGGTGVLSGVVAVAAGANHSLALRSDGSVVAWGLNSEGELGNGSTTDSSTPVLVLGQNGGPATSQVIAIAAGNAHSLALLNDGYGSVVGWGSNYYGQLGEGTALDFYKGPVYVSAPVSGGGIAGNLSNIVAIGAGHYHSLAVANDGTTLGWGYNSNGQLGDASTANRSTPVVVVGPKPVGELSGISAAAGGWLFSLGLRSYPCTAPTGSATKVVVQKPDGSVLPLTQGTTDAAGYTSWSGSYTIPTSTAEGAYHPKVCAVDVAFVANCDAAEAGKPPFVATPTVTLTYIVDNMPPTVSSTTPSPYADVLSAPTVSVTWYDNGSGVDTTKNPPTLSIDGASVPTSISGSAPTWTATTTGAVAPGVHRVDATASDVAGNVASYSFLFTYVTVSDGSASATLQQINAQPVDPQGTLPPPSNVTFTAPVAKATSFNEQLNASTWVGSGTLARPVSFDLVSVVFQNELGQATTATISGYSGSVSHNLAVLAPAGAPLKASVAAGSFAMGDLTVAVPGPPFLNTAKTTATLMAATAGLGETTSPSGSEILRSSFNQRLAVSGHLGACMEWQERAAFSTLCQAEPSPNPVTTVEIIPPALGACDSGGVCYSVFVPVQQGTDATLYTTSPSCAAAGSGTGCANGATTPASAIQEANARAILGCGTYLFPDKITRNLCTDDGSAVQAQGYAAAYLNAWSFGDAGGGFPLWQQDHAEVSAAGDHCPNGHGLSVGGAVHASTYRLGSDAVALDG